jgi:hypothetical protein
VAFFTNGKAIHLEKYSGSMKVPLREKMKSSSLAVLSAFEHSYFPV